MTNIEREKHTINATGKIGGRLASEIAILLMGKNKTTYQPNVDGGDFVEVANITQLQFSGKKMDTKLYYKASGYPGGLKTFVLRKLFSDNPAKLFTLMVYRMLPKNKLRREMIKRLTIS